MVRCLLQTTSYTENCHEIAHSNETKVSASPTSTSHEGSQGKANIAGLDVHGKEREDGGCVILLPIWLHRR